MNNIINFDNAATSYPKPANVTRSVLRTINELGGSAGRGGHILSMRTSEAVFKCRRKIADFFDANVENIVFCSNCTHALNIAINSIAKDNAHIIISSIEHNSVVRPLVRIANEKKISLSIAQVYEDEDDTVSSFVREINYKTKAIICTAAGNVTGQRLPIKKLAEICKRNNICFIVDGAQACGKIPISLNDGINIICTSGHKGLFGISGTGLLISDGNYKLEPLILGGTGSSSMELTQPDYMPDSLESGTLNTPGVISVGAGIDFIQSLTMEKIFRHEEVLTEQFISMISSLKRIQIFRSEKAEYVPIVSFNVRDIKSEEFASFLSEKGFCLRAGFHCSALAHKSLNTENGTIRFAPSIFNCENDVKKLCNIIKNAL